MGKMSITQQNTNIDKLSVVLQEARIILANENLNISFTDDMTRKIILLLSTHYIVINDKNNIVMLTDIINDFRETLWIYNFLDDFSDYDSVKVLATYEKMSRMSEIIEWKTLVFYAFETFEYSPKHFLTMPVKKGIHIASEKKKKQGIYYTPTDVIEFMVDNCIENNNIRIPTMQQTYLDCSCGTSVFLLGILRRKLANNSEKYNVSDIIEFIDSAIWGIDISKIAIDNCKIVLMTEFMLQFKTENYSMNLLWDIITNSFCCGDATNIENILKNNANFPKKYSCIVGNPPYVALAGKGNLFIPFVDNMMKYSDEISCSSLIVPLSICYSQSPFFVELRRKIINDDNATWHFYNFDRSPDSLFGDQVKTRNTIIFRIQGNCDRKILTTNLQRWTAENRKGLFKHIRSININDCISSDYIPKISTEIEKYVLCKWAPKEKSIFDMLSCGKKQSDNLLTINGTAYNWICAYDHIPQSQDENGRLYIPSSMRLYSCECKKDLYFVIGILCNRITYWYWTVIGDGFHLNNLFLKQIGIHKEQFSEKAFDRIAAIGEIYCKEIRKNVQVSYNSKKRIINYDYKPLMDKVLEIEKIVVAELDIPKEFNLFIEKWYRQHVLCGRKS